MPIPDKKYQIILDLCGGTGAWSKPYKDNGYDVRNITLPDYDVRTYMPPENVYGILAAPPCTMFSYARNEKTAKEKRDFKKGMEIVIACLNIIWQCQYNNPLKFWVLENPRGYLYRFLGRPVFEFDPCDFEDPYTKRTYLWGMFNIPKKHKIEPLRLGNSGKTFIKEVEHFKYLKQHQIPEEYKEKTGLTWRTIVRSITSEGFAKAFYEVNQ